MASRDCDGSSPIIDDGGIVEPIRLAELAAKASNLIEEYDVRVLVCLSESSLERTVDEEAIEIFEEMVDNDKGRAGIVFVYINSSERYAIVKGGGFIRAQWGRELVSLLMSAMKPELRQENYGAAIEAGLLALEGQVFRWVQKPTSPATSPISDFSTNVLSHVIFHELGHALMREFNIPVLGNEEDLADRFANYWITQTRGENAGEVLLDRVKSWVLEDSQQEPRVLHFKSEHSLDIRRAFQAGCYLYGADPAENHSLVEWLAFSQDDLDDCSDTTPDQIDGWASVIEPFLLQGGEQGAGVSLEYLNIDLVLEQQLDGLLQDIVADMNLFNWPRPIKLVVDTCEGTADWSRRKLSITLCTNYIYRFYRQGETLAAEPSILSDHLQKEAFQ